MPWLLILDGNFMIAVANGTVENPTATMIHCYRVSVKKQMDNLILTSQSLPSFFLTGGAARDIPGKYSVEFREECEYNETAETSSCKFKNKINEKKPPLLCRYFNHLFKVDIQRGIGFTVGGN